MYSHRYGTYTRIIKCGERSIYLLLDEQPSETAIRLINILQPWPWPWPSCAWRTAGATRASFFRHMLAIPVPPAISYK